MFTLAKSDKALLPHAIFMGDHRTDVGRLKRCSFDEAIIALLNTHVACRRLQYSLLKLEHFPSNNISIDSNFLWNIKNRIYFIFIIEFQLFSSVLRRDTVGFILFIHDDFVNWLKEIGISVLTPSISGLKLQTIAWYSFWTSLKTYVKLCWC